MRYNRWWSHGLTGWDVVDVYVSHNAYDGPRVCACECVRASYQRRGGEHAAAVPTGRSVGPIGCARQDRASHTRDRRTLRTLAKGTRTSIRLVAVLRLTDRHSHLSLPVPDRVRLFRRAPVDSCVPAYRFVRPEDR